MGGQKDHCLRDKCRYPKQPGGREQTRCILCNRWHHIECVKETQTGIIWTCAICAGRVSLIDNLHQDMDKMKGNINEMKESFEDMKNTNKELLQLLATFKEEFDAEKELRKEREAELVKLRGQIKEVTDEMQKMTNERTKMADPTPKSSYAAAAAPKKNTPPPPPEPKTLLIGTSLLRNVSIEKLVNCEMVAKGGAKVDDLSKTLSSMDPSKKFKEVILVAGSIDRESASQDDVINALKAFAVCASDRTNKVTISSVLPRNDKDMKDTINSLNIEIKKMCDTDGYNFLNHDPTFYLMNGEINRALLCEDGLHLAQAGVETLIRNCGLETKGSPYTPKRYTKPKEKTLFKGHLDPLSNFYPVKGLKIAGKVFHTSEAAYQHEKAIAMGNDHMARKIQATKTGIQAMRLGSKVSSNDEWQTNKVKVMEKVIMEKLKVCKEARDSLVKSGTSDIIENTGHPFWACGLDVNGQNMMGKILMMYRKKLNDNPGMFRVQSTEGPKQRNWATRDYQPKCYRCGETGHSLDQCRHRQDMTCWNCHRQGHKKNPVI